ncbi:MAG TPA: 5'/3'-nucleotidase SurE [Anaerolineae bacterium]|nr:5'/3'-nucleotidase SurE [Anaerolineae bacterium]HIQ05033.1 5'/3'-nucleotidase SurE [Anaerolineae bacterium]
MSDILVTNDDGIHATGLLVLKQALEKVGNVVVFAPNHNWSAAGHTKTMHKPLRVERVTLADGTEAFASSGAPSDCVGLALLGLIPQKPALVVSGINDGPNLGADVTYSGTVAGAMEAVVNGVPAIAVSLDWGDGRDELLAAQVAARLAAQVLDRGLPPNVLLNVNVPALPRDQVKGIRMTRLGQRVYRDVLVVRNDPRGKPYYWIGGKPPTGVPEEGTDIGAVASGYVSVTPLNMDMTDYRFLARLQEWEIHLNGVQTGS